MWAAALARAVRWVCFHPWAGSSPCWPAQRAPHAHHYTPVSSPRETALSTQLPGGWSVAAFSLEGRKTQDLIPGCIMSWPCDLGRVTSLLYASVSSSKMGTKGRNVSDCPEVIREVCFNALIFSSPSWPSCPEHPSWQVCLHLTAP